jgi:hypothetical protein
MNSNASGCVQRIVSCGSAIGGSTKRSRLDVPSHNCKMLA